MRLGTIWRRTRGEVIKRDDRMSDILSMNAVSTSLVRVERVGVDCDCFRASGRYSGFGDGSADLPV